MIKTKHKDKDIDEQICTRFLFQASEETLYPTFLQSFFHEAFVPMH